jgi:hypothetical protein
LELKRLREELSSPSFREFYRDVQRRREMLRPFPTPLDLIAFFHSDASAYVTRDAILGELVGEYQTHRSGPAAAGLGAFFLVLFNPGIVRVYATARRKGLGLDPDDILNQICVYLLETIEAIPPEEISTKAASRILGRVKNRMRTWVSERIREISKSRDYAGLEEEACEPLPVIEEGKAPVDMEEAARFLEVFVKAGVITETDSLMVLGTIVVGRSLKDTAGDARTYQRLKKRRQRAVAAMRQYLQTRRRMQARREGVREEDIQLYEIVKELLE